MAIFFSFFYRFITSVKYNESNNGLSFETRQTRANITYRVSNKDISKPGGHEGWHTVGYFSMIKQTMKTITWPGNPLFGPIERRVNIFSKRVVTRPAEPFVFVKEHTGACYGEVRCIKIIHGYPRLYPLYINVLCSFLLVS